MRASHSSVGDAAGQFHTMRWALVMVATDGPSQLVSLALCDTPIAGEPFLLADIGDILRACTATAPTTVLTNGMLFAGRRLQTLRSLPRNRVTLQISLDGPTPERHDHHRGKGTWVRAWGGVECARSEGFRVRLAATVSTDQEAEEFRRFLDAHRINEEDRVIRRIALRGLATDGVALARADLVPEITITAQGCLLASSRR